MSSHSWLVDEVLWRCELHEFNLLLLGHVGPLDIQAHAMVEVDSLNVVCANVKA